MKREHFAVAMTAAGLALSGAVFAQNATSGSDEFTLEEVIVTAERREENLQKVAATVTSISTEQLQDQGVRDVTDLVRIAPQINVATQNNIFTIISQRGLSTGANAPATESSTAVHLDGAYLSRFSSLNGFIFDTQRVEVVDGPQGTLYGRNAAAGTINYISNRPGDDFGGNASLEVGSYNLINAQAAVNLPLSDTIKTRASYYQTSTDGIYSNGEANSNIRSGRLSVLWKPTERNQLLVSFTAAQLGGTGGGGGAVIDYFVKKPTLVQVASITPNPTAVPANGTVGTGVNQSYRGMVAFLNPTTAGGPIPCPVVTGYTIACNFTAVDPAMQEDPWDNKPGSGWDSRGHVDRRNKALIAQYEHDLGFATLSASVSSLETATYNINGLATGYVGSKSNPSLNSMLYTAGWRRPATPSINAESSEWQSLDVHLTSNGQGQFKWIGGVYLFDERQGYHIGPAGTYAVCFPYAQGNANIPSACPPSQVPFATPAGNGNPSPYGQTYIFRDAGQNPIIQGSSFEWPDGGLTAEAAAVFGQVTWTPTFLPKAHLTLGSRYNKEERTGRGRNILNRTTNPISNWDASAEFSKTTYKTNFAYDVTDRNMVYVDFSTGFKSGGVGFGPLPVFKPELIDAFELGTKNRFLDDRLQVNLSVWHYKYTDRHNVGTDYFYDYTVSASGNTPEGSTSAIALVNAGEITAKGQALDLVWLITPNDRLRANIQHIEAIYDNFDLTERQTALHQNAWCTATPDGSTPAGGCVGDDYYNPATPNPAIPNTVARVLNLVPLNTGSNLGGTRVDGSGRPWSGNASYTHTFRTESSAWEATLSMQYQGSVDRAGAPGTNAYLLKQPSYHTEDLQLRYRRNDANWDLMFYARNFLDREVVTARGFVTSANGTANYLDPNGVALANYAYWTATYAPPRTYGAVINYRF